MMARDALARDVDTAPQSRDVPTDKRAFTEEAGSQVVLPRRQANPHNLDGRKDVRELQATIERAFALLDEAAGEGSEAEALPLQPAGQAAPLRLGAAPGSELRYASSWAGRIFKTFVGTVIVVVVGLIPLQRVTTPMSNEAYVDAPVYVLRAPVDGVIRTSQLAVGALVERSTPLALIESPAGSDTAVTSAGSGKVWEVFFNSGDSVARGDVVARVVGCSATRVTAAVSESVYDALRPGTPARFNFFGGDRFYDGQVAILLGHGGRASDAAIFPEDRADAPYRAIVSLPDLGVIDKCAVGRRGVVIFNPRTH